MSLPPAAEQVPLQLPSGSPDWRTLLRVLGPAYLVAVGYMDPGNWATDLAAGSSYGYQLLWVVGLSSLMAMVLQSLSCRLGIASGLDLAQACAQELPQPLRVPLWLLAELAIVACDLAELVGSAIALHLLVGLPLPWGVALTALDTLLLLLLQRWGIRRLEAVVIALVALVAACFAVELMLLQPPWGEVARGFIPQASTLSDSRKLFLAAGILGATVMPHNLYLHSSLVKSRQWENTAQARSSGLRFSNIDTVVALVLAFLVNAAILVLAGGSFYQRTPMPVADLDEAYRLLTPILGTSIASLLFGIGLLAAGQSSTLTATLAGQVVMEGFLKIQLPPWQRRLITRVVALVPAMVTVIVLGDPGINTLLVLSQVVLSLQLPFAVVPLVIFTASKKRMGDLVAPRAVTVLAALIALVIIGLNVTLVIGAWG